MPLLKFLISLGMDATDYQAGMKKVESETEAWGKRIGGKLAASFGIAAIATGLANLTVAAAKMGAELGNLSEQLGITVEEVQSLQKAADHSGQSMEKYAAVLLKIKKMRAEALTGDKTAIAKFEALGINPAQDPLAIMRQINPKTAAAYAATGDLVGEKNMRLVSSFKDISPLGAGQGVTAAAASALDEAGDRIGDANKESKSQIANLLGWVAGVYNAEIKFREGSKHEAASLPESVLQRMADREAAAAGPKPYARATGQSFDVPLALGPQHEVKMAAQLSVGEAQRTGGLFGASAHAGANVQKDQLRTLKSLDKRIANIETKVVSTPTEVAE